MTVIKNKISILLVCFLFVLCFIPVCAEENTEAISFDLLIRHPLSVTFAEEKLGRIDPGYLYNPQGGITESQLAVVQSIVDDGVVAPVALIGKFFPFYGTMSLHTMTGTKPALVSVDAVIRNEIGDIIWNHSSYMKPIPSPDAGGLSIDYVQPIPEGWMTVAAVDPVQEVRLFNHPVKGFSTLAKHASYYQGSLKKNVGSRDEAEQKIFQSVMPLLMIGDASRQRNLEIDIRRLSWDGTEDELADVWSSFGTYRSLVSVAEISAKMPALLDRIHSLPAVDLARETIDLNDVPKNESDAGAKLAINNKALPEYSGMAYVWRVNSFDLRKNDSGMFEVVPFNTLSEEIAQLNEYAPFNPYTVNLGVDANMSEFRRTDVLERDDFVSERLGSVDLSFLNEEGQKNPALALSGIYAPIEYRWMDDTAGDGMEPWRNPSSLSQEPARALTSLAFARFFAGRDDYIDAIRVRVDTAGLSATDAAQKIKQIAEEIRKITGLRVDIVGDVVPVDFTIDVRGMGTVETTWYQSELPE